MTQNNNNNLSAPTLFDQLRHDREPQPEPIAHDAPEVSQHHIPETEALETQDVFEPSAPEEPGSGRLSPDYIARCLNHWVHPSPSSGRAEQSALKCPVDKVGHPAQRPIHDTQDT